MTCLNPITVPDKGTFPCGKCLACRIMNIQYWSQRAYLEYVSQGHKALFITLTYDDNHLFDASLLKEDLLKYFKYLRKLLKPRKIKYFGCGEYGGQSSRPHFHSIIYGVTKADALDIRKAWCNKGFIDIKNVHKGQFSYVAKYTLKSKEEKEYYELQGLTPEFVVFSKGIGREYIETHREQLERDLTLKQNGRVLPLSPYLWRVLNYSRDTKSDINNPKRNFLKNFRDRKIELDMINSLSDDEWKLYKKNPESYKKELSRVKAKLLIGKNPQKIDPAVQEYLTRQRKSDIDLNIKILSDLHNDGKIIFDKPIGQNDNKEYEYDIF